MCKRRYVAKQREKDTFIDDQVAQLYEGDLNPVAPRAQKKVRGDVLYLAP